MLLWLARVAPACAELAFGDLAYENEWTRACSLGIDSRTRAPARAVRWPVARAGLQPLAAESSAISQLIAVLAEVDGAALRNDRLAVGEIVGSAPEVTTIRACDLP